MFHDTFTQYCWQSQSFRQKITFCFAEKKSFLAHAKHPIKKSIFQRTMTPTLHYIKANEQSRFLSAKTCCELAVQQFFFEKQQSCVCTTVTLSHRFKAFSPAFCRQNRFRHEPPTISAKSLPTELWIVPGVQRFANLWCTFGSFRTREKHEKRPFRRKFRGFSNLDSAHRSRSFAPQQLKPFKGASRFFKPRFSAQR